MLQRKDSVNVRSLARHGASLDFRENKFGFTALIFAADLGYDECVRIFLETGPIVDMPLINGQTVLMRASMHGQIAILDLILREAAVDMDDHENNSSLLWAARNGHAEAVNRLIQADAFVDLINKDGSSALSLATAYKDIVRMLIANGASLEIVDCVGRTPLMIATENERDEAVRCFFEAGA